MSLLRCPRNLRLLWLRAGKLALLWLAVGVVLGGCKSGTLKDPNDPSEAGVLAPEVLRQDLKGVSDMLNERLSKGEINEPQYQALIEKAANELLAKVNIDKVDPSLAWQYVEVLRTAGRWKDTERFAEVAVKYADRTKNMDRLVNDTLRLAQAQARLGNVEEAIKTARTVFNAGPTDSGPILMSTLYEIVPAAQGKGHDEELAKLLEDAIACHMRTVVDPNEQHGKEFLAARPRHIRFAWEAIVQLYRSTGNERAAQDAMSRAAKMMSQFARV